jgi:hypothetical protein
MHSPSEAVLSEIRSQVIAVLDSYDPEALPVILRFILQYGAQPNAWRGRSVRLSPWSDRLFIGCCSWWLISCPVTPANSATVVSGVRSHLGFETLSTNTQVCFFCAFL